MSISITLTAEEERKLTELAHARGQDAAAHARDVVTAYLKRADPAGAKSFEEILTPIWDEWRKASMTDDEVDELLTEELRESRSGRRHSKGTS